MKHAFAPFLALVLPLAAPAVECEEDGSVSDR